MCSIGGEREGREELSCKTTGMIKLLVWFSSHDVHREEKTGVYYSSSHPKNISQE